MISYAVSESTLMFGLVTVIWTGPPSPSRTDHVACRHRPMSTYPHLPRPNTIQALTDEGNAPQPCLQNNTRERQHHESLAIYQWPQAVILPSRQAPGPADRMRSGKQVRFRRTDP